jgi:hypothetical protein
MAEHRDEFEQAPELPVQVHGDGRSELVPMLACRRIGFLEAMHRHGESFIRQPERQGNPPFLGQISQVRQQRGTIQHVPQVDDEGRQNDDRNRGLSGNQPHGDELRGSREDERRHGHGGRHGQARGCGDRPENQPERKGSEKQREGIPRSREEFLFSNRQRSLLKFIVRAGYAVAGWDIRIRTNIQSLIWGGM